MVRPSKIDRNPFDLVSSLPSAPNHRIARVDRHLFRCCPLRPPALPPALLRSASQSFSGPLPRHASNFGVAQRPQTTTPSSPASRARTTHGARICTAPTTSLPSSAAGAIEGMLTVIVSEKLGASGLTLLIRPLPRGARAKISLCDTLIVRSGNTVGRSVFEAFGGRLPRRGQRRGWETTLGGRASGSPSSCRSSTLQKKMTLPVRIPSRPASTSTDRVESSSTPPSPQDLRPPLQIELIQSPL